jgi:DNA polymerase-1
LRYAALDAAILLPLAKTLEELLQQAGLCQVVALEGAYVLALAWLELAGLPIDAETWRDLARTERHRGQALTAQLNAMLDGQPQTLFGEPTVSWDSPAQVLALHQTRGHAVERTDSATLLAVADRDPLIPPLVDYREAAKRAGTYGESWLDNHVHAVSGRIHADYLQLGAATARMSCTKPKFQNLRRSAAYRGAIHAREGHVLVKADFSQIELRLAAVIAEDPVMLTAYRDAADLDVRTTAEVLGIDACEVTADHRQLAKALNFGLIYGMGVQRLQAHAYSDYKVRLTREEAERHRSRFFETYTGLARWHRRKKMALAKTAHGETRTLAGRRRLAVSRLTDALNTPVQGSGADGLKLAMTRLFQHRDEVSTARLIAVIHDAVLAECPEEDAEATAQWLTRLMREAMQELVGDTVPIVVDVKIGQSWAG